jgi:hypothetical protein
MSATVNMEYKTTVRRVPSSVSLKLTLQEAVFLRFLLGKCTGLHDVPVAGSLYDAMVDAGVPLTVSKLHAGPIGPITLTNDHYEAICRSARDWVSSY